MNDQKLIFIVDDDPFINMLILKRFSSDQYALEAFETGEDCLEAMNKNPDLVILDYLFPVTNRENMDGMQVLEKIKSLRSDLPVIILSAQDKGEVVLELARKGIKDYIIKDSNLISNLDIAIKELFGRES